MSIAGRRKRTMILAWFMGVLTVCLIGGILVLLSVVDISGLIERYRQTVPLAEAEVTMATQVVAARPIQAGTVIDADDLMTVAVAEEAAVANTVAIEDVVGMKTRFDMDQLLPVTIPMLADVDDAGHGQRLYEFDYVKLPFVLSVGDVIDVRILFPNGQDYVVLAKKEVIHYERQAENTHEGLLSLMVEEEEVLRMSSALVDAILTETAELYTVRYVDPVNQAAANISYPVNRSVLSILEKNPNLAVLPDMGLLTDNRSLLDSAMKELLDEDDEWFSLFVSSPENDTSDELLAEPDMEAGDTEAGRDAVSEGSTNDKKKEGTDLAGF